MRQLRPSSEAFLVALFLRTELSSDRFGAEIRVLLERDGVPERVVTTPDLGDDAEHRVRLRLLTAHRGYGSRTDYFEGFPDDVRWQWMAITPAQLASVRYIDNVRAPAAAEEYARRLAQRGVPIAALLRAYRIGSTRFQDRCLEELGRSTDDASLVSAAGLRIAGLTAAYIDRISEEVVSAYEAEKENWLRNRPFEVQR